MALILEEIRGLLLKHTNIFIRSFKICIDEIKML